MKCAIPEISWHNRDPVLSIDFQPQKEHENFHRLASGGTDSHVLIWRVYLDEEENTTVEFVSDLTRHQKAVNAVRFSPNGELLASGDDESAIIIWRQKQDSEAPELQGPGDVDTVGKEQWTALRSLRGHLEDVYDLSWSPDSSSLISGSVDNTAIVWDVQKGTKLSILDSHKGFVQGVAWDPLGQYLASLCSDRKMRVFNAQTRKLVSQVGKCLLPVPKGHKLEGKQVNAFHDDTIQSFFRRLCFSPDGQMLIAPSGVIEPQQQGEKSTSTTLVFGRNLLNRPVMYLPSLDEYSVCVKCCPVLFELRNLDPSTKPESMFLLPYRVVFAVATACAIVLYDTQQPMPFGYISNLHYTRLTDMAWSSSGDLLMVSSTDGYCSVITFSEGELGVPYKKKDPNAIQQASVSPIKEEKAKTVDDRNDKPSLPTTNDVTKHQGTITKEDIAKPQDSIAIKSDSTKPQDTITVKDDTTKPQDTITVKDDTTKPQDTITVKDDTTKPQDTITVKDDTTKPQDTITVKNDTTKPQDTITVKDDTTKPQDTITVKEDTTKLGTMKTTDEKMDITESASTVEMTVKEKAVEDATGKDSLGTTKKEQISNCDEDLKCKRSESCTDVSSGVEVIEDKSTSDLHSDVKDKLTVSDKVVTPVDSGKKARRVQLITLSSPKSKKKL